MMHSLLKKSSATDSERIGRLTDEEIDTSDIPPLDAEFFDHAELYIINDSGRSRVKNSKIHGTHES